MLDELMTPPPPAHTIDVHPPSFPLSPFPEPEPDTTSEYVRVVKLDELTHDVWHVERQDGRMEVWEGVPGLREGDVWRVESGGFALNGRASSMRVAVQEEEWLGIDDEQTQLAWFERREHTERARERYHHAIREEVAAEETAMYTHQRAMLARDHTRRLAEIEWHSRRRR